MSMKAVIEFVLLLWYFLRLKLFNVLLAAARAFERGAARSG